MAIRKRKTAKKSSGKSLIGARMRAVHKAAKKEGRKPTASELRSCFTGK